MAQYPYEVVGLKQFEIVRVDATGLVHQNGVGDFDCHSRFKGHAGADSDARIVSALFQLKLDLG